ncbi:unnamed protein product [Orchesella dallaii]|uniref:Uncharacterized protein n=1 Tax=Orchesella dallaii TaxID=48710 RepID=A0ABP1QES6_9HEXA
MILIKCYWCSVISIFFLNLQLSSSQYFDLFNRLESRVNTVNSTLKNHQKQIDLLAADMIAQQIIHDSDIRSLQSQLNSLKNQTDYLIKANKKNADNIEATNLQVLGAEVLLLEQALLIDKLNTSNQIWRANFQVVNRTFAELKKKLTLVVPVRGKGSLATIIV